VTRPTVVLAMAPVLTGDLFTPALRERLAATATLPDPEPLQRFDDERAARLLPAAEILLTGWGCPRIDGAVLAHAPRLRAIVHAAGTVKGHLDEAVWERGIRVSSAAAANAVPVAEYTLAAILFAAKRVFRLQRLYRELRSFRLWPREVPGPLGSVGRTVGIVGASRIGRLVLERLRPFDFARLLEHITKTRNARAGTIVGSGTVSNYDRSLGSACIAERRMLEQLEHGKPSTPFLKFGDRVRIEMLDANGRSIFGAIDQRVVRG